MVRQSDMAAHALQDSGIVATKLKIDNQVSILCLCLCMGVAEYWVQVELGYPKNTGLVEKKEHANSKITISMRRFVQRLMMLI